MKQKKIRHQLKEIEYQLPGYELESLELDKENGGRGTIVYFRKSPDFNRLALDANDGLELHGIIASEVRLKDEQKLVVLSV